MKSSDTGTVLPGNTAETEHLAHLGGLAGMFFRLARERFTGVMYVESKSSGGVFSIREGRAVFFEDLREGRSVPDLLLELELITKQQYADIAAEVVNAAADSEDVAFCQQAVALGIVSQQQIDDELGRRVRQRFVQAIGWDEFRVELDADPESLSGILEYPQALPPLVYTGIRTFFGEERIEAIVPQRGARFVRLLCSEPDAIELLQLDETEAELLARLKPDVELSAIIAQSGADALEARQLVCGLLLSRLAEVGSVPMTQRPRSERRPERSGEHRTGPIGRYSAGGVREERVLTGPLSRPVTPPGGQRATVPPSSDRMPAARRSDQRVPIAEERVGPLHPLLRDGAQQGQLPPSRSATRTTGPLAPQTRAAEGRDAARDASARRGSSGTLPAIETTAAAVARQPGQIAPPRELRRPRTLGAALQRLDRELRHMRPAIQTPAAQAAAAAPAPQATPSIAPRSQTIAPRAEAAKPGVAGPTMVPPGPAGRANVEHLMRMRRVALDQRKAQANEQSAPARAASEAYRGGLDALRLQKFPRAHELFSKACAAEPGNNVYSLYCQYAAFRAHMLSEEDLAKLRVALRDKIADADLKAFAYYALGHLALAEKKDEAAEKYFLKASELDKDNKDAERHLRILELRRKHAEQDKPGTLFGKR